MKDKVIKYFKETWPSKDELIGSTAVTVFVSVVMAAFVFVVDQALSALISLVLS